MKMLDEAILKTFELHNLSERLCHGYISEQKSFCDGY